MVSTVGRRTLLTGAAGATLAANLPMPAIAQNKPVKIGLLTVKTGPLAQGGIQMEQGTNLFLKDRNSTIAGRKVELMVGDTGGNPAGTKTKAQELIERDGVDMIFGPAYSPYLAQLSGVDAIVQGFAGSNPLKFMKQYKDAGLTLPVLGGGPACDDALLKSFGDEAVGMITASAYTSDLDTPSNKKLVEGMVRDTGNIPGLYAAGMYIDGMVAEAALEKTGGKTDDKEKLIEALRAVSLTDTPRGPFHFDHLGNVVGNIYIRRCEKKDGKLVNTTIKTYPDVSQFWTYDEKWFLAQPVYSRDYPPLKS